MESTTTQYTGKRTKDLNRGLALSVLGRDIGRMPQVVNPARKQDCARNFRRFCESYFPRIFSLSWSEDHLTVLGQIELAVLQGGLFATAMPRGSGKALALDTPLPTPNGWITMGDIQTGSSLYDESGNVCRVIFATPVMLNHLCYRVTFDDGGYVDCDADHLWTVNDRYSLQNPVTLPTRRMASKLVLSEKRGYTEYRYTIPVCNAIEGKSPESWHILPYMLGFWLGDGTTESNMVTIGDQDIDETRSLIERHETLEFKRRKLCSAAGTYLVGKGIGIGHNGILTAEGVKSRDVNNIKYRPYQDYSGPVSFQVRLRWLGVLGNKHIPHAYLRANEQDRMELLRGLMDTDGCISKNGSTAEYVTKLPVLRDDVMDLLAGLGFKRRCRTKIVKGRPYYRITFTPSDGRSVFGLSRKAVRQKTRDVRISGTRRIISIEPIGSVPVRCIQVDSPSHLYLCGWGMVPTHNTTLAETACIWAVLYGHREFIALIGSDEGHADQMLSSLKTELDGNDLLLEDFPEAVYPIRKLEGIAHRCNGQLWRGKRTQIGWAAGEIILPTIEGSKASGAVVKVAGITGGIRGLKVKRSDGRTVRPSLVVIDDPQTDTSARSPSQCESRERILAGAILGLAGPGKKISGIMPCTVICPNDMADRILNREKHPDWNGVRTKMVYAFPTAKKLWDEYGIIRADSFRAGHGGREATEFYREQQSEMDNGAVVAWAERYNPDEISAIQHAMNLKLQDERAFHAEYQNEPLPEQTVRTDDLTPDQVDGKINRLNRGLVSLGCNRLTAFIDVQASLLWYVVAAWEDDFTGYVIDYGSYPDQGLAYYTLHDAQNTLSRVIPSAGLEGQIHGGLEALTTSLLSREWPRDDGAMLKIERCLIDANWGSSTDTIYQFCRQSQYSGIVMPSHGKYVGASSIPMREYTKRPGEKAGLNWRLPNVQGKRAVRYAIYDTNWWKSFIHARLSVAMGDRGCLSLFGSNPTDHRMFADHLCAEFRVRTQGRGRECDEWKSKPGRPDNHLLDCLVGASVAASIQGVSLPETTSIAKTETKRISFAELQRHKSEKTFS